MEVPDSPTKLIASRYRLIRQVGTGSMNTVYEGEDVQHGNRVVAVKLLNTLHDELKQKIFRRETRALKQLEYPNIVQIFDYGWSMERKCHYIVLEYILSGSPTTSLTSDCRRCSRVCVMREEDATA